jgi:hypothetical protein
MPITKNARKEDFGEYQCCAVNHLGQTCSNVVVQGKLFIKIIINYLN